MPELPEVETVVRSLNRLLEGRRITGCPHLDWPRSIAAPTPDQFCQLVQDRPIHGVERRGKYILIQLDRAETLLVHLRMSGQLMVKPPTWIPDSHTHVVFALDDAQHLVFRDQRKFGRIWLLPTDEVEQLFTKLGPEPLDAALTVAEFATRLRRRRGSLKPRLLDQSLIAGLGNIYVDEALWHARLHPLRRVESLDDQEIESLFHAIQHVLRSGIERRGTTFGLYVDGMGLAGTNQDHLMAYGRRGQPCPRCGTAVEKTVVAQRGTYFCPYCQPVPAVPDS